MRTGQATREGSACLRRDVGIIRSDPVQMEMRILTALGEPRPMAARADEAEADLREATTGPHATPQG